MIHLISFKTAKFDTTKERLNPFNPIAGESVLIWLRENALGSSYSSTKPDAEDWGWYMDVSNDVSSYLVGSIAYTEKEPALGEKIEWLIQIHKNRSLKEKILGRNKMTADDALVAKILGALRGDAAFTDIEVNGDA